MLSHRSSFSSSINIWRTMSRAGPGWPGRFGKNLILAARSLITHLRPQAGCMFWICVCPEGTGSERDRQCSLRRSKASVIQVVESNSTNKQPIRRRNTTNMNCSTVSGGLSWNITWKAQVFQVYSNSLRTGQSLLYILWLTWMLPRTLTLKSMIFAPRSEGLRIWPFNVSHSMGRKE